MTWTETEAVLAQKLPGYEPRTEQRTLALAIEATMDAGEVIIAQAACGVGKSLANLNTGIKYAQRTGKTVALSTATKSLQSQYSGKDVPFLLDALPYDFTAVVLKGRGAYVCRDKLMDAKNAGLPNHGKLVAELSNPAHTGDFDDVVTELSPADRSKLSTSSDECPGANSCPFGDVCFAQLAKERAQTANLVIVNHALLVTDLRLKEKTGGMGMLPELGGVILDEAHELENYATNALGAQITERGIQNLGREVFNLLGDVSQDAVSALQQANRNFFQHLARKLREAKTRERTLAISVADIEAAESVLTPLYQSLIRLQRTVKSSPTATGDDGFTGKKKRIAKKIKSAIDKIDEILMFAGTTEEGEALEPVELVRWIEEDERAREYGDTGAVLKYAPLHVGPFLKRNIWDLMPAVLTSATMAIGSDFTYVAERHGITDYRTVDAGTPFDFASQAGLLVPPGADPTNKGAWAMQVQMTSEKLLKASGGRALLLFSSRSAMKAMHTALKPGLVKAGITVLMQGEDTTRALAEKFKSDPTSVLFGLKSFATGFDVQGDALELVIIDKMPFPVPTDVIFAARAEAINRQTGDKWASFNRLSVPMMGLDLLQAAGRLIRTKKDRGVIAILDSRMISKGYGRKVLAALPPAERLPDVGAAERYLAKIGESR